jgi:hypothetical protein
VTRLIVNNCGKTSIDDEMQSSRELRTRSYAINTIVYTASEATTCAAYMNRPTANNFVALDIYGVIFSTLFIHWWSCDGGGGGGGGGGRGQQ